MNMSRIVKGAVLSLLSMHGLNAMQETVEKETREGCIFSQIPKFAGFIGVDENQVSAINKYFYDKGDDARSFFFDLVFGKRKAAILHANIYIQKKKTLINKLSVENVDAAVKTRAVLLASALGYFAFCKGSTHGEAAIKGLLGATVGYFAYNNPLMKNWFLKSKKDQEMDHLVAEYECMYNLNCALDKAQVNKRAQELCDVDQEIKNTQILLRVVKDSLSLKKRLKQFKHKKAQLEKSPLPYEGEIIDPRVTIKRSKISAMDKELRVQNIPWASVDEDAKRGLNKPLSCLDINIPRS